MYFYYTYYLILTIILCYCNYKIFKKIDSKLILTEKQKAYTLSFINSLFLSVVSNYLFIKFYYNNFDEQLYRSSFSLFDEFLSIFTICFFTSFLIIDSFVGTIHYYNYMLSLDGYIHHLFYIIVNICTIYYQRPMIFILFLAEELPTFLLSVGRLNTYYRSDKLFGFTFFITRIVYHTLLCFLLKMYTPVPIFGTIALLLHTYWFKNWVTKYTA